VTGRAHRVGWGMAAVLLMAIGGLGLALTQGAFGERREHTPIVSHTLVRHWNQGGNTSFGVAGGIAAVVAVLGLVLIVGALRGPAAARRARLGDLRDDSGRGNTIIRVKGLRRAVEREMGGIDGVGHANVALVDRRQGAIEVDTLIEVEQGADLAAVAKGVTKVVGRFGHTVGRPMADTGVMARLLTGPSGPTRSVQ
jgi:hypothetical protein